MHELGAIYLGNKMTGIPYFNAPWFDETAAWLRTLPEIAYVFNPVERDRAYGFIFEDCPNGTREEADAASCDYREALTADLAWITACSDGMLVGPQWRQSSGAIAEVATHQALGLPVWSINMVRRIANAPYNFDDASLAEQLRNGRCQIPRIIELLKDLR